MTPAITLGRSGHASLSRLAEPFAQQQESHRVDREDREQQQQSLVGRPQQNDQGNFDAHGWEAGEQRGVGAVAGEMLPKRDLEYAERADDHPHDQRRAAVLHEADDQADRAEEDCHLGNREPSERARRPFSVGPQRV